MEDNVLRELVDRYVDIYFFGLKRIRSMIPDQVLDVLTPDQFIVLCYLNKNGPCLTSQVADYCGVNRGATTAMIDRLVSKGYVERSLDDNDRRIVLVNISDKGKELVELGYNRAAKLLKSMINEFDQQEIETFLKVFEKASQLLHEGYEED